MTQKKRPPTQPQISTDLGTNVAQDLDAESRQEHGSPRSAAETAKVSKSVADRVFLVLLSFDPRHRAMTLSAISRRTALPVATVYRLLNKLEGIGAVERGADGLYSIGPLMWRMGILAPTHDVIGRGARPLLMSLSSRTAADVRVLSYFDESAMCVDEILSASMSADSGLGEMHPLHTSAGGIALAAQLTPENRAQLRLTKMSLNKLEQHILVAGKHKHVALEDGPNAELALIMDVRERPPMSISIRYKRSPGSPGLTDAARLAALQETARSLSAILNEGMLL